MAALLCSKISSTCSSSSTCSNPFGYLVLPATVLTNLPPIVVGLQSLSTASSCKGSLFCTITMMFAACHISAMAYISTMISNRHSRRLAAQRTYSSRLGWLLCQDAWVAAYLVTLVLYVLWLWIGVGWRLDGEVHDDGTSGGGSGGHYAHSNGHGSNAGAGCPNHVGNWVDADVFWGFVFLMALLWMLILSFFVACCCDSRRDYSYVAVDHNIGDEEQMMLHVNGGVNQQSINTNGSRKQKKQYGTVPSATAAVATPTPTAPPFDPKIPVATATPIDLDKR